MWLTLFIIYYALGLWTVIRFHKRNSWTVSTRGILPALIFSLAGPFFYFLGKRYERQHKEEVNELKKERDIEEQLRKMTSENIDLHYSLMKLGTQIHAAKVYAATTKQKLKMNIDLDKGKYEITLVEKGK